MSIQSRTRKVIAQSAVLAAAAGFAALPFAAPASAEGRVEQDIGVAKCTPPLNAPEVCTPMPTMTVDTAGGPMNIVFTADSSHCSDMFARIFVDHRPGGDRSGELGTKQRVAPGQSDGGRTIDVSPGPHEIGVLAEGIPGGCNTGRIDSWAGHLSITYPEPAQAPKPGTASVVFEVTGSGEVYNIVTDPTGPLVPDHTQLPWERSITVAPDVQLLQVVATGRNTPGPGCRILLDGKVVAEQPQGGSAHCMYQRP